MIFSLFAVAIAAAFFVSSLILLNYGRQLGLRYRQQQSADSMAGLPSVEGAVFALIGLLVAFTVSGALHRSMNADNLSFRRQLQSALPMIASICLKVNPRKTSRKN